MSYFAHDDGVFADGYYVEEYDLRNWEQLVEPIKQIVRAEAAAGNKVCHTQRHGTSSRIDILLWGPARRDWSNLPDGVALFTQYTTEFPVYDTDLYAIYHVASGHRVRFQNPNPEPIENDS